MTTLPDSPRTRDGDAGARIAEAIRAGIIAGEHPPGTRIRQEDVAGGTAVVAALRASHPTLVIAIGGRRGPLVGNGGVVQLPDGLDDAVAVLSAALS